MGTEKKEKRVKKKKEKLEKYGVWKFRGNVSEFSFKATNAILHSDAYFVPCLKTNVSFTYLAFLFYPFWLSLVGNPFRCLIILPRGLFWVGQVC